MAAVLANYPFVSQLAEQNVNDRMDCVAASLASAIEWLDHKSVTGSELKNATYGVSYVGGTSLVRYVDQASDLARRVYGVNAEVYTAEPSGLVQQVHTLLRQGYPVIATIPSAWGTAHSAGALDKPLFSTHAIAFYGELSSGGLEAMNPWGGFNHTGSDSYWTARLCYRQVWRTYRVSGGAMGVPQGWKDDGTTLVAPNGMPVVKGMRTYVLAHPWDAEDWPLGAVRYVANVEPGNPAIGQGARQDFRMTSLGYTEARGNYRIWTGQDLVALQEQVAALQQQQQQPTAAPDPAAEKALAAMQAIKTSLGELS